MHNPTMTNSGVGMKFKLGGASAPPAPPFPTPMMTNIKLIV